MGRCKVCGTPCDTFKILDIMGKKVKYYQHQNQAVCMYKAGQALKKEGHPQYQSSYYD